MSSKWFVCCPPAPHATGGSEVLHQAAAKLRRIGVDAYMYYYGEFTGNPVAGRFSHYDLPWVADASTVEAECILVPEVLEELLYKFPDTKRVFWWLSVDNFARKPKSVFDRLRKWLRLERRLQFETSPGVLHAAQSHYAAAFLAKHGLPYVMLSDFLCDSIMQNADDQSWARKENIVVYNPAKGIEYSRSIMALLPSVTFVPLSGLSQIEVGQLLSRAKCYIDFGNHPGKDRIPREAAMNQCCVVVGKRGSARFFEDVPIPDRYKIDMPFHPPAVAHLIETVLHRYSELRGDFELYRSRIRNEQHVFEAELASLVATIRSSPADLHGPSTVGGSDQR